MSSNSIEALEKNIEQAKQIAALGDSLERLRNNKDFKAIISKGYLQDEAVRLVHLKADPGMQDAFSQASIVKGIDAIGALSAYFRVIERNASTALKAIEADRETIAELHQEVAE